MGTVTTWREHFVTIAVVTPKAIGIETDETEDVIDQRDGRPIRRAKVVWLVKACCRLKQGKLERGQRAVLEVADKHWRERMGSTEEAPAP